MKDFIYILFFLLIACTASAQQTIVNHDYKAWQNEVQKIINGQGAATQQKSTQIKERVMAGNTYVLDTTAGLMAIKDSFDVCYKGNHGSAYNYSLMDYVSIENDRSILYDTIGNYNYHPISQAYKTVCHYNILDLKDTIAIYAVQNVVPQLYPYWQYSYYYTGSRVDTEYWGGLGPQSVIKIAYTYNLAGIHVADTVYSHSTNNTDVAYERVARTFDAANNVLTVTYQQAVTNGWRNYQQTVNTYDASNRLTSSVYQAVDSANNFYPSYKDSFGYTGNVAFTSFRKTSGYDTGTHIWSVYNFMIKKLNAAGLPDSLLTYNPDTDTLDGKVLYNSYGDPKYINYYRHSTAKSTGNIVQQTTYYYNTYNDATNIKTTAGVKDWKLYPNPATDALTLMCKGCGSQAGKLMLINMEGRIVREKEFADITDVIMSVTGIAPGIYQLAAVNSEGEQIMARRVVKK